MAKTDLYFFKNEFGRVKIGKSSDVKHRCGYLERMSGVKIKCIHTVEYGGDYEVPVQKYYKQYRDVGEWFILPDEELIKIKSLTLDVLEANFRSNKTGKMHARQVHLSDDLEKRADKYRKSIGYDNIQMIIIKALVEFLNSKGY